MPPRHDERDQHRRLGRRERPAAGARAVDALRCPMGAGRHPAHSGFARRLDHARRHRRLPEHHRPRHERDRARRPRSDRAGSHEHPGAARDAPQTVPDEAAVAPAAPHPASTAHAEETTTGPLPWTAPTPRSRPAPVLRRAASPARPAPLPAVAAHPVAARVYEVEAPESSVRSCWTRASISLRIIRTSSTVLPAGSSSSQSR